jgi:hypothetical protein
MKRSNNVARDLPTTSAAATPFKASSSAAVYRSLEVPLVHPQNLDFSHHRATTEKSHPSLVGPTATKVGEAFYGLKTAVVEKEARPLPIPLIVANAPHNSVFIQSDPVSRVVEEVGKLLAKNDVDVEFNSTKFKWKCACYAGASETRFVVRMFSVPEKTNYFVLDFQRRFGDAFHFQSVHRAMHNELLKSGFVIACPSDKVQPSVPIRAFKPLALPANFFDDESKKEETSIKDYEPLCQMCRSSYIDVQREGLTALSSQLENTVNARSLLVPFAVELTELVARSRDPQVRRLALTCLSWITSTAKIPVNKDEVQTFVNILITASEVMEIRRQAGHVLLNINTTNQWKKEVTNSIKSAQIIAQDARLATILNELGNI